jgi:hypothetical protein
VPRPFPIESGTISKPECNFTHFTINFLFAPFHFSPRSFWCQIDQLPYHYPAIILKRRTTPFTMIVTYPFHVSAVAKTDQQRAAPVPPNFTSVTASASSRARGGINIRRTVPEITPHQARTCLHGIRRSQDRKAFNLSSITKGAGRQFFPTSSHANRPIPPLQEPEQGPAKGEKSLNRMKAFIRMAQFT